MAADGLGGFLEALEDAGELARVAVEVDPELEIAEITDRVAKAGGPALVFERVRGQTLPVVTNLLGSPARILRALGAASFAELDQRLAAMLRPPGCEGWVDRFRSSANPWAAAMPKAVGSGASQQVVGLGRDVDLTQLPALRSWPQDAAAAITAGMVVTRDPELKSCQVSRLPLAVVDARRLAIVWDPQDAAARHFEAYRRQSKPMPLGVVLGGDPALAIAAALALPSTWDTYMAAGCLRGSGLSLVSARTMELDVPADGELVIEGQIDPRESPVELGPMGSETGYYAPRRELPVIQVTAVTRRANPVFPAIVAARPPHEISVLRQAALRIILPLLRRLVPELVDAALPAFGAARRVMFASIRKNRPHQAGQVSAALWGLDVARGNRLLVVVDETVDVHDTEAVLFAVASHTSVSRDVLIQSQPSDWLDHASAQPLAGHATLIDATIKLPGEHPRRWPDAAEMSDTLRAQVTERWTEYGLTDRSHLE